MIVILVAGSLTVGLAAALIWLGSELRTPYYNAREPETYVDISRGMNTNQIAYLLAESGILHSRLPFIAYLRYTGMSRRIQAGEYRFAQAATPKEVAQRLIRGDVCFKSITVPEGLTAREAVELLARNGLGSLEGLEQALLRTDWIKDLDPKAQNLEGYLFPETYRFSRRSDPKAVIKAMVDQFRQRFKTICESNTLKSGWDVRRVVTLASMIEKEVKKAQEGPLVASVFVNRLEKKIPLSCDATIIYAMKQAGTYSGNLSKQDLKMNSPYNTYLHLNLPPSPICNPGTSALLAAINPARTDYLYYVSRNDGTHQFSEDFRSHTDAVNRYQKSLARRGRKSD
jgi:UPF0755 protein